MFKLISSLVTLILLSLWYCEGHYTLHERFVLTSALSSDKKSITFTANVTTGGWVAIGFNYNKDGGSMYNSDYFMAAANATHVIGKDFYVLPDAEERRPREDPNNYQNWRVLSGNETVEEVEGNQTITRTVVTFSRALKTTDDLYDLEINNSTLNLIWAFHNTSDDFKDMHSVRGSAKINFINCFHSPCNGEVGDGEGTPDGNIGAGSMVTVGVLTILFSTVTSILRSCLL